MRINPTKIVIPKEDRKSIFFEMDEVFESGRLTLGEYTKRFEKEVGYQLNSSYVTAVSSGSSALEIAALSLKLTDFEVIIPTNTFIATVASFIRSGANVVLADCDEKYGTITLNEIKRLHTKKTKAVVVVHIGGIICPEIHAIRDYCKENKVFLIEDAAHAIGAYWNDEYAGTFSDIGAFSFYPTKVVTSGEGGIITTSHKELNQEFKIYRDQGKQDFNNNLHVRLGSNWRLSELHSILGFYQMKRLKSFIKSREDIANIYNRELSCERFEVLMPKDASKSNWYKLIVNLSGIDPEKIKNSLAEQGVMCGGEVYKTPCHLQPIMETSLSNKFKGAEVFANNHICLPISADISELEVEYVCKQVKNVLKQI